MPTTAVATILVSRYRIVHFCFTFTYSLVFKMLIRCNVAVQAGNNHCEVSAMATELKSAGSSSWIAGSRYQRREEDLDFLTATTTTTTTTTTSTTTDKCSTAPAPPGQVFFEHF